MKTRLSLSLWLLTVPAWASGSAATVSLMQWLASCFLVIALILVLAWLLKKTRLVPSMVQSQLKVISMLPLGSREKLLVVKVGEQQLLLGMTPNQISLLCQLDKPLLETAGQTAFANQLSRWMGGHRGADGVDSTGGPAGDKKENKDEN